MGSLTAELTLGGFLLSLAALICIPGTSAEQCTKWHDPELQKYQDEVKVCMFLEGPCGHPNNFCSLNFTGTEVIAMASILFFFSFLLSQFSRFRACFDNIPSLLIEELYIFIFIFSGVPKRRWGKRDWKGPGNSSVVRSWTVPGLGCPTVRIAVIIKWTSRTKPASFNREKATRPHQKKKRLRKEWKEGNKGNIFLYFLTLFRISLSLEGEAQHWKIQIHCDTRAQLWQNVSLMSL